MKAKIQKVTQKVTIAWLFVFVPLFSVGRYPVICRRSPTALRPVVQLLLVAVLGATLLSPPAWAAERKNAPAKKAATRSTTAAKKAPAKKTTTGSTTAAKKTPAKKTTTAKKTPAARTRAKKTTED